ncbi:hypothetical protein CRG98_013259 [Punica granatum]|uniref:Reverse transcriptase RNase H-like domain-containing protein n=1 Tax=Punica granatum TaxID=22663 RepID=A0A2I0KCU6_PUNGR|nr:hypothetical protein CRG98_013259 [Punica granatum]
MCCALVWVMQRLWQYLYHTVRLLSKTDPLKYLLSSPSSMRNIAKWRCQLTEYDIEYVSRTSVKGQAIGDHLAEFPIVNDTPINSDFLDEGILQMNGEEEITRWKMYFDGTVNSTGSVHPLPHAQPHARAHSRAPARQTPVRAHACPRARRSCTLERASFAAEHPSKRSTESPDSFLVSRG